MSDSELLARTWNSNGAGTLWTREWRRKGEVLFSINIASGVFVPQTIYEGEWEFWTAYDKEAASFRGKVLGERPEDLAMPTAKLRDWLTDEWFCGCGDPEKASASLLGLLEMLPLHEDFKARSAYMEEKMPDEGIRWLMYYALDSCGLTEHGSSAPGWLTPLGKDIMKALKREASDDFETLWGDA